MYLPLSALWWHSPKQNEIGQPAGRGRSDRNGARVGWAWHASGIGRTDGMLRPWPWSIIAKFGMSFGKMERANGLSPNPNPQTANANAANERTKGIPRISAMEHPSRWKWSGVAGDFAGGEVVALWALCEN